MQTIHRCCNLCLIIHGNAAMQTIHHCCNLCLIIPGNYPIIVITMINIDYYSTIITIDVSHDQLSYLYFDNYVHVDVSTKCHHLIISIIIHLSIFIMSHNRLHFHYYA